MAAQVADLFVVLDSITDPFSKGMKRAAADAESESGRMSKALKAVTAVGVGLAVGVGAIGLKSIDMAAEFQTTMTRLVTAAGAPKSAIEGATTAVLQMGTQVGMTGTAIADALYHPISAGLDLATSLQVVKYAAEEAQISGASLDDTTYSLSSVMKAFNEPASQAGQTMADLNAIVGQGDVHFQDFNQSIKNWAPTAAQMGISVNSMGAALDYLMDRGNGAEEAATRLTMGLSMMATPTKQAATLLEGMGVASSDVSASSSAMTEILKKTGITQNQLALDLQKPDGIYVALTHLTTAMDKAGIRGTEADSVLSKLFGGGRSDKAIMSLIHDLSGLQDKFGKIQHDSTTTKFESDWETAKNTFAFQIQQMKAGIENFGIELGTKALPGLSSFIATSEKDLGSFFTQVAAGFTGSDLKAPKVDYKNSRLNQDALGLTQPQSALERFGQTVHTVLIDIEDGAKRLEPVGRNFVTFGLDLWQAGEKIFSALEPTAKLIGGALLAGIEGAGKAAANILGPSIKWFADFLDQHRGGIETFSKVVLGGMILKMTILGGINAAKGVLDLATAIVGFPLSQTSQIGEAVKAMKVAWTGKEAKDGEDAVKGLAGAMSDLKKAGSGVLDKILPDSGKLAGMAKAGSQVGQGMSEMEKAAQAAVEGGQLSLFETDLGGIVQVAEQAPEQLSLFETGVGNIEGAAAKTEGATSGLLGKIGKFALAGGVIGGAIFGLMTLGQTLGQMAGVGDHTAMSMETLNGLFDGLAHGSATAGTELTTAATSMTALSGIFGGSVQGLQQLDQGMAQLVSSGHLTDAKAQFAQVTIALEKQGLTADQIASDFPQYEQAVKNAGDAAQTMDGQVTGMTAAISKQQALTNFNSDLQNLSQTIQSNADALTNNSTAATVNKDAVQKAATALTGNSQAALANQQALQQGATAITDFYNQQRNAGVGIAGATTQMYMQIGAFERTAVNAGMAKGDVDTYISTLLGIPQSKLTEILADTTPAQDALSKFLYEANNSSATVTVYQNSAGEVLTPGSGGYKARASGGPVTANNTYWVGEDGPELVTFGASGYVTPTSMLQPAVLAGASGSGGAYGGGSVSVMNINVTVQGNVTSEKRLVDVVRTQVLQFSGRNSGNGLSLP